MTPRPRVVAAALGGDRGRGSLLAIQPWLGPADYACGPALQAALEDCLTAAFRRGWISSRSVLVFPEYAGTWLAVAGEGAGARRAPSLRRALACILLRHPFPVLRQALLSPERDRLAAALFRAKAAGMARTYSTVFGGVARRCGVTVVGGSIVLPAPRIEGGVLVPGRGPLVNCSVVFRPDGSAAGAPVVKAHPTEEEMPFTAPGSPDSLPVFDTPAGRLGVLICADAWFPSCYESLRRQGADLLAVPAFITGADALAGVWQGYSAHAAPPDVRREDTGSISEGEAWRRYATMGRAGPAGFRAAVQCCLRDCFWDLGSDGSPCGIREGETFEMPPVKGPALLNVWL